MPAESLRHPSSRSPARAGGNSAQSLAGHRLAASRSDPASSGAWVTSGGGVDAVPGAHRTQLVQSGDPEGRHGQAQVRFHLEDPHPVGIGLEPPRHDESLVVTVLPRFGPLTGGALSLIHI